MKILLIAEKWHNNFNKNGLWSEKRLINLEKYHDPRKNPVFLTQLLEDFTINVNKEKLGKPIFAIDTAFMKSIIRIPEVSRGNEKIIEAFRISGEGCYSNSWLNIAKTLRIYLSSLWTMATENLVWKDGILLKRSKPRYLSLLSCI